MYNRTKIFRFNSSLGSMHIWSNSNSANQRTYSLPMLYQCDVILYVINNDLDYRLYCHASFQAHNDLGNNLTTSDYFRILYL